MQTGSKSQQNKHRIDVSAQKIGVEGKPECMESVHSVIKYKA